MSMNSSIAGILRGKCPKCKQGDIYQNKSVFPLKDSLRSYDNCANCGQKIKTESSHAPSINYALSVVVYAIGFILYALIWGMSYKDNSVVYALISSTLLVIICQPWLIRFSKTVYLYLYTSFH